MEQLQTIIDGLINGNDTDVNNLMELLSSNNKLINKKLSNNITPLMGASFLSPTPNNIKLVHFLLTQKANVNDVDNWDNSPLMYMCHYQSKYNNTIMIKLLLDYKANVNFISNIGNAPIKVAIIYEKLKNPSIDNRINIIKLLLDYRVDVNLTTQQGTTLFSEICQYSTRNLSNDIIKLLLNNKADANTISIGNNWSPLMITCKYIKTTSNIETVKLLLDYGADITFQNFEGMTPLLAAIEGNNIETIQLLLDKKADVNTSNNSNTGPLHLACYLSNPGVIKLLLSNKANINAPARKGFTSLMIVCNSLKKNNNNVEPIKILLDNKADINVINICQYTALNYLFDNLPFENTIEFIKLLINPINVGSYSRNGRFIMLRVAKIYKIILDNLINIDNDDIFYICTNFFNYICNEYKYYLLINSTESEIKKNILDTKFINYDIHYYGIHKILGIYPIKIKIHYDLLLLIALATKYKAINPNKLSVIKKCIISKLFI